MLHALYPKVSRVLMATGNLVLPVNEGYSHANDLIVPDPADFEFDQPLAGGPPNKVVGVNTFLLDILFEPELGEVGHFGEEGTYDDAFENPAEAHLDWLDEI